LPKLPAALPDLLRIKLKKILASRCLAIFCASCAPSPQQLTHVCVAAITLNAHHICTYLLGIGDAALPQ
jgi:hypothetical protein